MLFRQEKNMSLFLSDDRSTLVPFSVDGKIVGLIRENVLPFLSQFPEVFNIEKRSSHNCCPDKITGVSLDKKLNSCESRTSALRTVAEQLRQHSEILVALKGWRHEV